MPRAFPRGGDQVSGEPSVELEEKITLAKRVEIDMTAPDFALDDFQGRTVRLSDYRGKRPVILVFNRGFL
jgi:hypothetical protein